MAHSRATTRHAFLSAAIAAIFWLAPLRAASSDWSLPEEEQFLSTAEIIKLEPINNGFTKSRKATLTDGHRTHFAHVQTISLYMPFFKGSDGSEERDFKDNWKFNVAAYRLAKLLHLTNMVPVSVERIVEGKPAAVTWWVDDVLMDERKRVENNIMPPDAGRWRNQMDIIRVFDQLIYNMDRNRENLLITTDWRVFMIDHSRTFRKWTSLRSPAAVTECDPQLVSSLKTLTRSAVERELGPYLTDEEIAGLMARRDIIVGMLEAHARTK
jgi:hypothetical protein